MSAAAGPQGAVERPAEGCPHAGRTPVVVTPRFDDVPTVPPGAVAKLTAVGYV